MNSRSINHRQRFRRAIETMEPRRLLATLVGTELRIDGTAGNDRIRVETIGANVVVTQNAVGQSFEKSKVRTINANLRKGNDRIEIVWNVNATTTISGEAGNDTIVGSVLKDAIYTGSGNNVVYGNAGGDFIQTSVGDDLVAPGFGNDTVNTGSGNDQVSYADRSTAITGSILASLVVGSAPDGTLTFTDRFTGTVTSGSESDSLLNAEALTGGGGGDTLSLTTAGPLSSSYPDSADTARINGGAGNDTITVADGFDDGFAYRSYFALVGSGDAGNDLIETRGASGGRMSVLGGDGNDTFRSQDHDTRPPAIAAGGGIDVLEWSGVSNMNYTMPEGLENLSVISQGDAIHIIGNDLANEVRATTTGGSTTWIEGRGGNDTLIGSEVSDSILGGEGNDLIRPGLGNDTINGGTGLDEVSYADRSTGVEIELSHGIAHIVLPGSVSYVNYSRASIRAGSETDTVVDLETATLTRAIDSIRMTGEVGGSSYPHSGTLRNQIYRINAGESDDRAFIVSGTDSGEAPETVHQQLIDGGSGNDVFDTYAVSSTSILGGEGNDTVIATYDDSGAPSIDAGPGVNLFHFARLSINDYTMPPRLENMKAGAAHGGVNIRGNDLDNTITLLEANGDSTIDGAGGNDRIDASIVPDFSRILAILGGAGNDTILGTSSSERLEGGDGDDSIDGGGGRDSIFGGAGIDRAKRDTADAIVDSIEVLF